MLEPFLDSRELAKPYPHDSITLQSKVFTLQEQVWRVSLTLYRRLNDLYSKPTDHSVRERVENQ